MPRKTDRRFAGRPALSSARPTAAGHPVAALLAGAGTQMTPADIDLTLRVPVGTLDDYGPLA